MLVYFVFYLSIKPLYPHPLCTRLGLHTTTTETTNKTGVGFSENL